MLGLNKDLAFLILSEFDMFLVWAQCGKNKSNYVLSYSVFFNVIYKFTRTVFLAAHAALWTRNSRTHYASIWQPKAPTGSLLLSMAPCGSLWLTMATYGSLWLHMAPLWLHMAPKTAYSTHWLHMDSCGFLRLHVAPIAHYGSLWVPMTDNVSLWLPISLSVYVAL